MRACLVEPRPAGPTVYDFSRLPRLGLPLIGALLTQAGHEVSVQAEVLAPVDLATCMSSDVVGISSTTATAPAAYRLADHLARAGVPVVLGGPHVTYRADEALEHAPFVARGAGQATMLELVSWMEHEGDEKALGRLAGLSWRAGDGSHRHNPDRPMTSQADFARLPAPDLTLMAGYQHLTTKPVMTQWGCPFDCEFCSVTAMFSRRVRHRPVAAVADELARLDAESIFFYDDNFVVNKARATALLETMVARGLTAPWSAQVRADVVLAPGRTGEVDHAFLSLMRLAGARMTMIGFESASDEGLAQLGKRSSVATARKAVAAFHEHGIAVHGMFVAGLDTDDSSAPMATADFARATGIDTYQLMAQTPLPGTRLWDRAMKEGRILSEDWSLFDGHQVVMRPLRTSPLELQLSLIEATRHFYSWPRTARSAALGTLSHLPAVLGALRPGLVGALPGLLRAARASRWDEVTNLMRSRLPAHARHQMVEALWLPAVRLYARRQLATWWGSERARDHVARLSALPAQATMGVTS